ncbi:MAG TPA: hypothetical protein VN943_17305 [Candidatus Acidoferrum sp.]|nr:hypothetical protein [Candidatus Acidoferrum sp.]
MHALVQFPDARPQGRSAADTGRKGREPAGGKQVEKTLGAAPLRVLSKGAVLELSFHAIQTIEFKFTIDIRPDLLYGCVCYLEQTFLIHFLAIPLTLNLSRTCRPLKSLASLFSIAILCFQ